MKQAIRLSSLVLGKPMRATMLQALNTLWTIEGEQGIFSYVQGCKADHAPAKDQIVAKVGDGFAIFQHDTDVESVVCQALGVVAR